MDARAPAADLDAKPEAGRKVVIELDSLEVTLPSRAGPVDILKGLDLQIDQGEAVSVVGPSGSGKTTLLMVIAGLERATGGKAKVASHDLTALGEDDLATFRRDQIGIVFQSFHLIPAMTALENVAVPLEFRGSGDAFAEAKAQLELVGLGHRLDHYPGQLSGGEQQRVALARALAPRPAVVLLDEPFAGLDPLVKEEVLLGIVEALKDGERTVLCATHELDLAARIADRVAVLSGGKIVAHGPAAEVVGEGGKAPERMREILAEAVA